MNDTIPNINDFSSSKKLKQYVRKMIDDIGPCEDIKNKHPHYYLFLLELFKRHPKYEKKTANLINIKIRYNPIFTKQLEVLIEKKDGKIIDISALNKCITGKNGNDLLKAMRYAINPQINEFRQNNNLICSICNSQKNPHVDHYIPTFKNLSTTFILNNKKIPYKFEDTLENTKCFRKKDNKFETEWIAYHKENAQLRILCRDCNCGTKNKNEQTNEQINVYTDGSCINNGTDYAIAGCGVYFGENDPRNHFEKLEIISGHRITNNRAELKAILIAINKLLPELENKKQVMIYTDSQYSISIFTSNNIKKDKPNSDYAHEAHTLIQLYPNIKLQHILAHTGKSDCHSIGNDNADKLANLAIINDIPKIIVNFGKYKGKTLNEIHSNNPEYLKWCINNCKSQNHDIQLFLSLYDNK